MSPSGFAGYVLVLYIPFVLAVGRSGSPPIASPPDSEIPPDDVCYESLMVQPSTIMRRGIIRSERHLKLAFTVISSTMTRIILLDPLL